MIRLWTCICILSLSFSCFCQLDCDDFKKEAHEACKIANQAFDFNEFSIEYLKTLNTAISIDSTYGFAYRLKSIPYLKSGDFVNWKFNIDKAVKHHPYNNLVHRAFHRYYHFNDFKGAIGDIEIILRDKNYEDKSHLYNNYNIEFIRALCFKGLGLEDSAISAMENLLFSENYWPKKYDFVHLGRSYLESDRIDEALNVFLTHRENFELAETEFYLAQIYAKKGMPQMRNYHLNNAHDFYLSDKRIIGQFSSPFDKIYLKNIMEMMK